MNNNLVIFLQLLLAHVLTDFVLQPGSWVRHKREFKAASGYLYFHSFLAGFLSYLLLQQWSQWEIPAIIAITHFFIDLWKLYQKEDNLKIFLWDQFLHFLVIVFVSLYLAESLDKLLPEMKRWLTSAEFLVVVIAYLLIIFPAGFLIGKATQRWEKEIGHTPGNTSLQSAGRYIGIFERILVLTFILTNNFSAIGFLIAAKSILRFSDKSEIGARKQTEYVLIGTLMSFAITIIIGLLARQFFF